MTSVEFDTVGKVFSSNRGEVVALSEASLSVDDNEIVCLVGPSGCGKTTLLNLTAGFLQPTSGRVLVGGKEAGSPDETRAVVFQQDAVFPWLTVRRNIEYGPRMRGQDREAYRKRAEHFMSLVALERFADAYPKELSGGMRKRVDLARAYVNNPDVLLMDEPFGALDVFTREAMWDAFHAGLEREPKTVLFVTHDIEEAIYVGDRIVMMTPRPARVHRDITVPFPRGRSLDLRATHEFQDLRHEIAAEFASLSEEDGHE
jgi:NitT/TauT family transport system ATP-binding protein